MLHTDTVFGSYEGIQLDVDELKELGLEDDVRHFKLEFDNEATVKHAMCVACTGIICFPPFWLLLPCVYYGVKAATESRKGAVTESTLVLKQGAYGCCCMCWNEKTKSVSLEKVTDLSISQGCLERSFNVKSLSVENASSSAQAPEMVLVGLKEPEEVRKLILKARDYISGGGRAAKKNVDGDGSHLNYASVDGDSSISRQLLHVANGQHETLIDIRDIMVDVRTALSKKEPNNNTTNY